MHQLELECDEWRIISGDETDRAQYLGDGQTLAEIEHLRSNTSASLHQRARKRNGRISKNIDEQQLKDRTEMELARRAQQSEQDNARNFEVISSNNPMGSGAALQLTSPDNYKVQSAFVLWRKLSKLSRIPDSAIWWKSMMCESIDPMTSDFFKWRRMLHDLEKYRSQHTKQRFRKAGLQGLSSCMIVSPIKEISIASWLAMGDQVLALCIHIPDDTDYLVMGAGDDEWAHQKLIDDYEKNLRSSFSEQWTAEKAVLQGKREHLLMR